MPRRALRQRIPAGDLRGILCSADDLPQPWNTESLFGAPGDLIVEVGCGKGMFLQNAAAARPSCRFLGIELAHKYAQFAAGRMQRLQLSNVRIVAGDAVQIVTELLGKETVHELHLYFPDPWWKHRHRRRRVLQKDFVKALECILVPGGQFHFWTDVQSYFEESLVLIAEATSLVGPLPVPEPVALHDLDYRTHFERRVRLNHLPVYRAEFHRSPAQFSQVVGFGAS